MPQRGQAQGRLVACRLHRRARWRAQRRGRPARPGCQQLAPRARQRAKWAIRCRSTQLPLSDAEIATLRQWVDQGARLTPSSPPAPAPWEAPLALTAPAVPAAVWAAWNRPADRLVAAYLSKAKVPEPRLIADAAFARRAYLDIWGLAAFSRRSCRRLSPTAAPDKRDRLVATLLADNTKYARELDVVLERPAPQRRRPDLLLGC